MAMTKRVVRAAVLGAGLIGAVAAIAADTPVGSVARRMARRLTRDVRYGVASAPGIAYRLTGRHPDANVSDDILADRIRSSIGPLQKRLDLPHVHVMVEDRCAILHGDIAADGDARAIEHAIMQVSGVRGVESHLHAGLIAGDTRPSEGAATQPRSGALNALLDAARTAGAEPPEAAVHAVLCGFCDRIPHDEREQMIAHLPADVRALLGPARRLGEGSPRVKTLEQLAAAASVSGGVDADRATEITRAIVTTLHGLVPDEARDVAAVLPKELRELWATEPIG